MDVKVRIPYNIYGYFSKEMCILGIVLATSEANAWEIFLGWPSDEEILDAKELGNCVKQVDIVTREHPYDTIAECAACKANREAQTDPSCPAEFTQALHSRSWVHAMRR